MYICASLYFFLICTSGTLQCLYQGVVQEEHIKSLNAQSQHVHERNTALIAQIQRLEAVRQEENKRANEGDIRIKQVRSKPPSSLSPLNFKGHSQSIGLTVE